MSQLLLTGKQCLYKILFCVWALNYIHVSLEGFSHTTIMLLYTIKSDRFWSHKYRRNLILIDGLEKIRCFMCNLRPFSFANCKASGTSCKWCFLRIVNVLYENLIVSREIAKFSAFRRPCFQPCSKGVSQECVTHSWQGSYSSQV